MEVTFQEGKWLLNTDFNEKVLRCATIFTMKPGLYKFVRGFLWDDYYEGAYSYAWTFFSVFAISYLNAPYRLIIYSLLVLLFPVLLDPGIIDTSIKPNSRQYTASFILFLTYQRIYARMCWQTGLIFSIIVSIALLSPSPIFCATVMPIIASAILITTEKLTLEMRLEAKSS